MPSHLLQKIGVVILAILPSWLLGQVAINVKLGQNNDDVYNFFQVYQNQPINNTARQLANQYVYLKDIKQIRSLTKQINDNEVINNIYTLHFDGGNTSEHLNSLRASGVFDWVEPVKTLKLDATLAEKPNDDSIDVQWHHSFIKTFEAWAFTKGNATIKVGVIDTGIDYGHPDLEGSFAINTAEDLNHNGTFEPWESDSVYQGKTGDLNFIDEDGNGFEDDVLGYDFVDEPRNPIGGDYLDPDADPIDENMHGTFVSGLIFAKPNNKIGGAGIAPDCKLVTLRAFGGDGSGEDDDIARAIIYAADNGVKVLNLSFGDAYPSLIMHAAIQYAYAKGVIMIASAGNGTGDDLHYPSSFDEVISISASAYYNNTESIWQATSYGHTVAICAPGADIFSTTLRDSVNGKWVEYTHASGTSASAPMVSAAVALLIAQRGDLTPQQARGLLVNGADDIFNEGWDHYTGAGRLNILKSLQIAGGSNVQILSPQNDTGSDKDKITITGTVLEPELQSYSLEYQQGIEGKSSWTVIKDNLKQQIKEDTLGIWDMTGLPEGDYTLRLKVTRTSGFTTEDRIRFVRDKSDPMVILHEKTSIWDNNERKMFFTFRSSDQGIHTLYYRKFNTSQAYQAVIFDRTTHNGEFLLTNQQLSNGLYEYYIETKNYAGLIGKTPIDTFSYNNAYVEMSGYKQVKGTLPMGNFVQKTTDLNNNGFQEIYMNEFDEKLHYGRLKVYEYSPLNFQQVDSASLKKILLPKDLADINNDGSPDLLCNVNDSTLILSNSGNSIYPTQTVLYQRSGNDLYPAQFADTDNNSTLELLMKNFKNYYIYQHNGNDFSLKDSLPDVTPNYIGSIAPRVLVADFDQDNLPEIIYGDYDGDFIIYEYNGSGGYTLVYQDTTDLYKAGEYLVKGDFDGDNQLEFAVVTHTLPGLKNADLEYDASYSKLRIFKATGNNTYKKVWEDNFYDIDTDEYNAMTAGNLDLDNKTEIIFSSFPRTYIIEHENGAYKANWFYYGSIATSHIISDFNGNGVAEFGLGRGDSTLFYEKDVYNNAPQTVTTLTGNVLGANKNVIRWQKIGNAEKYLVFRGIYVPDSGYVKNIILLDSVTTSIYYDNEVNGDKFYFYVIRSCNNNLIPPIGEWSNYVILKPHFKNKIDSISVINDKQLIAFFTEKMRPEETDKAFIKLNNLHSPTAILPKGDKGIQMSFDAPFEVGTNKILIDTSLIDRQLGYLDPNASMLPFDYTPTKENQLYLTHWEDISLKDAILYFNFEVDASALDTANYEMKPVGSIRRIEWFDDKHTAVKVTIQGANFGALGYPISITLTNIIAVNQAKMLKGEGNTAIFSSHKADLSQVYVYPNPVRPNALFEGLRFANLTQKATIKIFTLSGRYINTVEETDGDGGTEWNMLDQTGKRITPGVYLFEASAPDVKSFIGKFTVIE